MNRQPLQVLHPPLLVQVLASLASLLLRYSKSYRWIFIKAEEETDYQKEELITYGNNPEYILHYTTQWEKNDKSHSFFTVATSYKKTRNGQLCKSTDCRRHKTNTSFTMQYTGTGTQSLQKQTAYWKVQRQCQMHNVLFLQPVVDTSVQQCQPTCLTPINISTYHTYHTQISPSPPHNSSFRVPAYGQVLQNRRLNLW